MATPAKPPKCSYDLIHSCDELLDVCSPRDKLMKQGNSTSPFLHFSFEFSLQDLWLPYLESECRWHIALKRLQFCEISGDTDFVRVFGELRQNLWLFLKIDNLKALLKSLNWI